jgi:predicted phosphodiesterase
LRYLVLTDIHANLEALNTCLADAKARGYERSLVLGDLVGYGADPNPVVERVQALEPVAIVRGNHDKVACGLEQPEGFNAVAKIAARWTLDALSPSHREWLAGLPEGPTIVDDLIEICHGSPYDEDAYITDEMDAVRVLKVSARPLCLFGHTHYPAVFELSGGELNLGRSAGAESRLALREGAKYLVNPGSVGQPRDGDPRAAYAIVDSETMEVELVRVDYPIAATQSKLLKAGLPEILAQRLTLGR